MDYDKLQQGQIVSCAVKCTYTELYTSYDDEFEFVFSVQKKDFPQEIGMGIVEDVNSSGLVPITINEKFKEYLLNKTKGEMTTNYRLSSILNRSKDILYVKPVAIACDEVLDENVEVEEIVEETKKDYSKLIWIALAAAAALL